MSRVSRPEDPLPPYSSNNDTPLHRRVASLVNRRHELIGLSPRLASGAVHSTDLTHAEYARVSSALLRLQRGLTGNRNLIGERYMDDPDLLAAYLLFYWPVSYAQVSGALAQSGLHPRRILDMGSGPGPATAAFLDVGTEEAVLVDSSQRALDLARRVLTLEDEKHDGLSFLEIDMEKEAPGFHASEHGPFDCVVFGHSLNELWPEAADRVERRLTLVRKTADCIVSGGALLVVEPALLSTSRDALELRDGLMAEGWSIAAPCCGRSRLSCPALTAGPGHTCHDELRWETPETVRQLAERTGLDKESLKATWILAYPPGSQAISPYPEDAFRVVSDPLLNKAGRTRYLLCGKAGRFAFSAPAQDPRTRESGFHYLRRGDVIRVTAPELRENGWGLGADTRIEMLGV
jgi:SAM-dependent methyltransferase